MLKMTEERLTVKVVPGKYGLDQTEVEQNNWVLAPSLPDRRHWYEGPNGEFEDDDEVFMPNLSRNSEHSSRIYKSQKAFVVKLA
jgi:hypothetical protein